MKTICSFPMKSKSMICVTRWTTHSPQVRVTSYYRLSPHSVCFSLLQKLPPRFNDASVRCRVCARHHLPGALRRHRSHTVHASDVLPCDTGRPSVRISPTVVRDEGRSCSILSASYSESPVPCEPTTKHISSYLNEKFLKIIGQYFSRVSPESEYFYFCTEEERSRQTRSSVEMEDRTNNHANGVEATPTSGPYKFDETNGDDQKSERDDQENGDGDNDDDEESVGTVHIYGKTDDDELELQLGANRRRRSDVSSSSMSNRSRELSGRGDILPLFLCFACRLVVGDDDYCSQVKSIPLCLSTSEMSLRPMSIDLDPSA